VNNYESFTVTQPEYSAVYRDPIVDDLDQPPEHKEPITEYLDVCEDQDLGVCPYSPLHGGSLTGKYERAVGEEVDATPAQVSLRWLMDHERFTCVPIVGARTVDQLDENFGAIEVELSDDQWERIDAAIDA